MAETELISTSSKTVGATPLARRRWLQSGNRFMRISHMYSAAPVLLLMLFFAVTGVYLNHPELEDGGVSTRRQTLTLPPWARGPFEDGEPPAALVPELLEWLDREHDIAGIDFAVEYDELDEVLVIDLASPDGTTVVELFFDEGKAAVDQRELSLLAKLNNLHRAKHVTGVWRFLSDFSAVCMIVFSISGCWLLVMNKLHRQRSSAVLIAGSGLFLFTAFILH